MDGIPSLPDDVAVFTNVVLLVADALSTINLSVPQWGIFLDGEPVVLADNVISFEWSSSSRVSKYPQEQGAFASYNKVTVPAEPRLKFSRGGSVSDRQDFIQSVQAIADDLNLYDIVTPEVVYSGYNVVKTGYPRTAEAAGIVSIDVFLEQIVIAGASTFSNTQNPSDAGQQNNGLVQPDTTTVITSTSLSPK